MSITTSNVNERVSKVTFSAINSDALVVSIRSIMPKPDELAKMNIPKVGNLKESKKKSRSRNSEKSTNKSTMTDYKKEISIASQTSTEEAKFSGLSSQQNIPCLKHAARNISTKAKDMPSEKVSLCNNCSKSMLSYIFVVQDFLDSLAKEICSGESSQECVQCRREQVREQIINRSSSKSRDSSKQDKVFDKNKREISKMIGEIESQPSHSRDHKPDESKNWGNRETSSGNHPGQSFPNQFGLPQQKQSERHQHSHSGNSSGHPSNYQGSQSGNLSFTYPIPQQTRDQSNVKTTGSPSSGNTHENYNSKNSQNAPYSQDVPHQTQNQGSGSSDNKFHNVNIQGNEGTPSHQFPSPSRTFPFVASPNSSHYDNNQNIIPSSDQSNQDRKDMIENRFQRQQPDTLSKSYTIQLNEFDTNNFSDSGIITSPLGEEIGGGISGGLSNVEREVYDSARNNAGWENLAEAQERLVGPDGRILSEAYVTLCRNNAEAIGALVVGTSLLLTQTSRTLCVVVSDGVSMAFRGPLSAVFHVLQTVRSMDSLGTTKLALLEQPELGISFDKLNLWRLKQFRKCVYLNPDTLVIQNCDELFNREELSAVPDVGWPDCFNCGVFVLQPSEKTFWQLLEYSDKHGSHDGGDQGLLNAYFNTWSGDINKKLSFIYNLMANVSYTYTPAFKQFGRDVKIVQFHGSFKPWHVKFFNVTGLISPASNVHPNYVEFVNTWIKIFKGNALRQLSQEIQSYAASQELVCAVELLRFFPLPSESEAEFFLTPPSVRLRLTQMKLRPPKISDDPKRRKSAEYRHKTVELEQDDTSVQEKAAAVETSTVSTAVETSNVSSPSSKVMDSQSDSLTQTNKETAAEVTAEKDVEEQVIEDPNKLPGAEVGNYQGMKKWEQGKMDYEGKDSSDSVIKRLEFLMTPSK